MDRNLSALMTSSVIFIVLDFKNLGSCFKGEVDQDPVLFAVRDKMSYLLGALVGVFVLYVYLHLMVSYEI